MKSVGANLLAHLAAEVATLATCWKITLTDGTVLRFTDHNDDIKYEGQTYLASTGYTATDIADSDALNVDNLEVQGVIEAPSITEEDLRIGRWDNAAFDIFELNYNDLTQGVLTLKTGTLGEVTLNRNQFAAELRGLTQAYTRTIGQLDSPTCRAQLGDTRCGVSLTALTVTGTLDSVNADLVTLYDAARTEAGPSGGRTITNIEAVGGVDDAVFVTLNVMANEYFSFGDIVTISGVVGTDIEWVNAITRVGEVFHNGFFIPREQSPWYGTADVGYTSGGTVSPMIDSGYFDGGLITFTSGLCDGFSQEVKAFVPGQITLHLPMPYALAAGDTYSMVAGCDKSLDTCRDRFNNVVNFRGEPYLPGIDKVLQTGR